MSCLDARSNSMAKLHSSNDGLELTDSRFFDIIVDVVKQSKSIVWNTEVGRKTHLKL